MDLICHDNVERPPRTWMPTLYGTASYWAARDVFSVDIEEPHCFGCGTTPPADMDMSIPGRWNDCHGLLERAHLVDHALDGLDGPQNIVPLCRLCHRLMPSFGDGQIAIRWVLGGGGYAVLATRLAPMGDLLVAGRATVTEFGTRLSNLTGIRKADAIHIAASCAQRSNLGPMRRRRQATAADRQDTLFGEI